MKNKLLNNFITTLDKNLPTILTGISVLVGIATTGYAVYAGYKTKEIVDDIPEDAKFLDRAKKIAPRFVPVVVGVATSAGCAIAANHENGKRYAALAATLAATRLDIAKVQAKVEEVLGIEKSQKVKEKIASSEEDSLKKSYARMMANADKRVLFRDMETGYIFRSTLNDFIKAQKSFNDKINIVGEGSINDFYFELLKDEYMEASTHNDVVFGKNADIKYFSPDFDVELGPDMQPVYVIAYKYDNTTIPKLYID